MTGTDPQPLEFALLRQRAIGHAQAASGKIWTDFNLHDPGVTLLEQTCFSLTEISYQTSHAIRDLLTGAGGRLDVEGLALFDPARVLPGEPVTDLDLAAQIAAAPQVGRVLVSRMARQGLYALTVIPAVDPRAADPEALETQARHQARAAFYRHRPLACDLGRIRVARRRETALEGEVQITAAARPERVAAEIYYHVSAILRGQEDGGGETRKGATRADVFEAPQSFFHAPTDQDGKVPDLETHLSILRAIPGVAHVGTLALRDLPPPVLARPPEPGQEYYRDLVLPATAPEIGLTLTLHGIALVLNPNRIREEVFRVAADHIARARHHLDEPDWAVLWDGRRRDFTLAQVDALLPALYRTAAPRPAPAEAGLDVYRSAIDTHLAAMAQSLAALPEFFSGDTDRDAMDPARQRQRIAVLDHLVALQGEEMPPTQHSDLHLYRGQAQRGRFELWWRIAYLRALPAVNAARGTGPHGQGPGGFLGKLRLLADLPPPPGAGLTAGLAMLGLTLDAGAAPPVPTIARADLVPPETPFDMLVRRDDTARPLAPAVLLKSSPWIAQGRTTPELFLRSANPSNYIVAAGETGGHFHVLFDPGHGGPLYRCATHRDKAAAAAFANRLRNTWRALHADAEGAYLVEDILLRGKSQEFASHSATLVLTGWTARAARPAYRAYVATLLARLAPAHLLIRPLWLEAGEMARFERLQRAVAEGADGAPRALRALLAVLAMRRRLEAVSARLAALPRPVATGDAGAMQ
ncbi:MAG: hypothetical protein KDK29_18010 [Sedimentitalea sp.]|nr:hypothetical protein [Sedimentitalea sp.]